MRTESNPGLTETDIELSPAFLRQELRPFLFATLSYGTVGSLIVLGFTAEPYSAFFWYAVIFALCVANLYFLSKAVAVLLDLMSHQGTKKGLYGSSHLILHGSMKLAALVAILLTMWKGDSAPLLAKMMGLGTLFAVPLIGGLLSNRYPGGARDTRSQAGGMRETRSPKTENYRSHLHAR